MNKQERDGDDNKCNGTAVDDNTRVVRKIRFPMICHNEKHVYWH
jgi:hypothetical protein